MSKLVFILEDDININEILKYNLEKNGFEVKSFYDGESFNKFFNYKKPDIVILDLMLPDIDGFDICKKIKKESDVPVLILSAKGEELDKVLGLELGADDYMVKPFGIKELIARVKNILKKYELINLSLNKKPIQDIYYFKDARLKIDEVSYNVFLNDKKIDLNPKEFKVLVMLLKNINNLVHRNEIIKEVWGNDYFGDTRTLDVHIRRIRSKMSEDDFGEKYIKTVHSLGYKLIGDTSKEK